MKPHFTYADKVDFGSLCQGDLLKRTDALDSILKEFHPYFSQDNYKFFLVLTQSCDLVRRDGVNCSANYISIAAVRPLEIVVQREATAQAIQKEDFEIRGGICRDNRKNKLKDILRKIFDNNHKEYFYLHEDEIFNLDSPHCAFLRISIALKAEHYDKCLDAKRLELTEEFRAKLGWLVGDLYSRIGTQDWIPKTLNKKEFDRKLNDILNTHFIWFESEIIDAVKRKIETEGLNIQNIKEEQIKKMAMDIQLPKKENKKEVVLKQIEKILTDSGLLPNKSVIDQILALIGSDVVIRSKLR